ncbi:MAG: ATP-binding protein [Candidatus Omnitrophota bacterium]
MNPYNFSLLCFAFCSFLLGLLIFLKRQDEIGKQYLFVVITQAGWAIFFAIYLSLNTDYNFALLVGRISHLFALFIPTTWYRFVISYTGQEKKRKSLRIVELFCLIFSPFVLSPWFIPKMASIAGFTYYVQAGPIYHLFTGLFFVIVPLSFFEILRKIKNTPSPENRQYKGLFWAAFAGYLGGGLSFLPVYGVPFLQYGLFLMPMYPFGVAYFMIKSGLFDMEQLAQAAHRDKLTAIGVLAASINHEVKNPLFIIKGLAESCLERQKEGIFPSEKKALESANDAMKRSMEQADRAMDIIKRLSLFAKAGIDSEIKFEPVKVAQVVEDILPLVRYELAAHGIALSRDMPSNLPEVRADRRYLEEIFFNLIVNACQAVKETGKPGEIVIRAVTANEAPSPGLSLGERDRVRGSNAVIITIQDNGLGIPADKLKDVFRPFYTTKAEGTGLGLYITQQLVEKIHGRIDVRSEVGAGTTFSLSLPGEG